MDARGLALILAQEVHMRSLLEMELSEQGRLWYLALAPWLPEAMF